MTLTGDEDEGVEERMTKELIQRLVASCEGALSRGLSPSTIHRTLLNLNHTQTKRSFSKSAPNHQITSSTVTFPTVAVFLSGLLILILLLLLGNMSEYLIHPLPSLLIPSSLQSQRCLLPSHPLLMEMVRPIQDNCAFCTSHNGLLELQSPPSKSWFEGVAYKKIPIIVRGGSSPSPPPLDLRTLKAILESEPDFWADNQEQCQFLPFRSPFTSLRHALESISTTTPTTISEPWYIGWSNCHPGIQEKLRSLIPRPDFLPEGSSAIDWIFLGWPGRGAAMHIDYVRRPSWQLQLSGVKTWVLKPPPECETKCPVSIRFTTYPGDLLFLETNLWYHETFVEGEQLSISLGSEYD